MPTDRNEIECWRCTHEMAADAQFWLRNCSDADLEQLSSMGRPRNCCKIRVLGHTPKAAHAPTR
jgi:hypothetical protein